MLQKCCLYVEKLPQNAIDSRNNFSTYFQHFFNFYRHYEQILYFNSVDGHPHAIRAFMAAIKPLTGVCSHPSKGIETSLIMDFMHKIQRGVRGCGKTLETIGLVKVIRLRITPYDVIEIQQCTSQGCLNDAARSNASLWFQPAATAYITNGNSTHAVYAGNVIKGLIPSSSRGVVIHIPRTVMSAIVAFDIVSKTNDIIETVACIKSYYETLEAIYIARGNSSLSYSTYAIDSILINIQTRSPFDIRFNFSYNCDDTLKYIHQSNCCSLCNHGNRNMYIKCDSYVELKKNNGYLFMYDSRARQFRQHGELFSRHFKQSIFGPVTVSAGEAAAMCRQQNGNLMSIGKLHAVLLSRLKHSLDVLKFQFWIVSASDDMLKNTWRAVLKTNCQLLRQLYSLLHIEYTDSRKHFNNDRYISPTISSGILKQNKKIFCSNRGERGEIMKMQTKGDCLMIHASAKVFLKSYAVLVVPCDAVLRDVGFGCEAQALLSNTTISVPYQIVGHYKSMLSAKREFQYLIDIHIGLGTRTSLPNF